MLVNNPRNRGYTLIELMITVAVLAIVVAVAVPAYSNYTLRARRTEAMDALTEMANRQERAFSNAGAYTTNFAALPYPQTTENGLYTLQIVVSTTLGYQLTAIPNPVESQAGDGNVRLTATGAKTWDKDNNGSYSYDWSDR